MPQQFKHLEVPINFMDYVKNKKVSSKSYFQYFLSRCTKMFQYKGLPDTIPHEILDRYLFLNGISLITEVDGSLYCFYGNLGGPLDVYYRPSLFIVANPHIHTADGQLFSANVKVFDVSQPKATDDSAIVPTQENGLLPTQEGVLIRNDTEWQGLAPMIARYSALMAENILTLRTADVMLRITALISTKSDAEAASAREYLRNLENGELSTIGESPFFEGINLQSPPSNNGSYLTQFIEYQQYLKGSFFNEIGLSANYNMKREAIGKGESTLDEDALLPLIDNMLLCRREDLAKVNSKYGTNIEVDFSSAWLENTIESLKILRDSMPSNSVPVGQPSDSSAGDSVEDLGQPSDDSTSEGALDQIEPELGQYGDSTGTELGQSESTESEINDISSEGELTEILESLEEAPLGQPTTEDVIEMNSNNEEGGEEVDRTEESSDDEGDNPES